MLIANNTAEYSCCLLFRGRESLWPCSSNFCQWL